MTLTTSYDAEFVGKLDVIDQETLEQKVIEKLKEILGAEVEQVMAVRTLAVRIIVTRWRSRIIVLGIYCRYGVQPKEYAANSY
jgi:hypothetical protein